MNVAVAGKGGSGKTTVAGTLARSIAAAGYDVLAIDDDDDPNLSLALGVPREDDVPPLPGDLVEPTETAAGETGLGLAAPPEVIVDDHGTEAPDGVSLVKVGEVEAGGGCFCGAHATARYLLASLVADREGVTVMDMVAGLEHFGLGTARDVDTMLVVVEPYYRSLETGRRTRDLAAELDVSDVRVVANKVRDEQDRAAVEEFCADHDLEIAAVVPFDDAIRHADRDGTAPIDHDPDAEAVSALRRLADDLTASDGPRRTAADATR